MNGTTLSGGAQYSDLTQVPAELWMVEGNVPFVYGDGKGIPTIGVGLNLLVASNMAAVLNLVSINGVGLFAQAAPATNPNWALSRGRSGVESGRECCTWTMSAIPSSAAGSI